MTLLLGAGALQFVEEPDDLKRVAQIEARPGGRTNVMNAVKSKLTAGRSKSMLQIRSGIFASVAEDLL